ncbi:hypothetical protein [Endozoicomonas sp. YOMI1]|uniref:hypothetical protein n=1 Tax=Endozoicomonas sp. YOMI1 TaxID=2828739 RepID=UPI00214739DE|nr:hypothetical protein [Endozoicomonas sp. YOMI1]
MDIEKLLKLVAVKKASDLFITAGFPPSIKLDGRLIPVNKTPLTTTEAKDMVLGVMDEKQRLEFELKQECNFAIAKTGVVRFRLSALSTKKSVRHGFAPNFYPQFSAVLATGAILGQPPRSACS